MAFSWIEKFDTLKLIILYELSCECNIIEVNKKEQVSFWYLSGQSEIYDIKTA